MSNLTSDLEHLRASNRELETNIVEYQVKLNGYKWINVHYMHIFLKE